MVIVLNPPPRQFLRDFFRKFSLSNLVETGFEGYRSTVNSIGQFPATVNADAVGKPSADPIERFLETVKSGAPFEVQEEAFRDACEEITRKGRIAIYAINHKPNEVLMEDALMDMLVKMWQKRHKTPTRAGFCGYLGTTAKNNYRNLIAQKRKAPLSLEQVSSEAMSAGLAVHDPAADPGGMTEDECLDEALCRMRQLDPKGHALIEARIRDRKTQEVASAELGIPLGSMTYELRRAVQKLKRICRRLRKDQGHYEE